MILGARNAEHVEDHRATFAFQLDDEDRAGIRAVLDKGRDPPRTATSGNEGEVVVVAATSEAPRKVAISSRVIAFVSDVNFDISFGTCALPRHRRN